jgi:hypothetical protein
MVVKAFQEARDAFERGTGIPLTFDWQRYSYSEPRFSGRLGLENLTKVGDLIRELQKRNPEEEFEASTDSPSLEFYSRREVECKWYSVTDREKNKVRGFEVPHLPLAAQLVLKAGIISALEVAGVLHINPETGVSEP